LAIVPVACWIGIIDEVSRRLRDTSDRPFLATAGLGVKGQYAPGGLETFRDAHGALWAVLDTWNRPTRGGRFRCCRSVLLAEILSV
jgi:hypothetical protein